MIGTCESCGRKSLKQIFDSRVKRIFQETDTEWMYLCPACHALKGNGFASNDLTIYEKHLGKYVEVLMEFNMNATEVRNLTDQCKKQALTHSEAATMSILGEIAAQLATLNASIQANTIMMASFIERINHGAESSDDV